MIIKAKYLAFIKVVSLARLAGVGQPQRALPRTLGPTVSETALTCFTSNG